MFKVIRFTDPQGEKRVRIVKMSYVWAGLFGPFFVLAKAGPVRALLSLCVSLACAIGLIGFIANIHFVPDTLRLIALVFAIPGIFLFHSFQTVGLVTNYYRRLHWVINLH